jgi:hypothetical protein
VIQVDKLERDIPKDVLMAALTKEAPNFLRTLLDMNLPSAPTRLRIPVIDTQAKFDAMEQNQNPIVSFIAETCFHIPGATIPFKEFYARFVDSTPNDVAILYKERAMRGQLPKEYPVGKIVGDGNTLYVANLSFDKKTKPSPFAWVKSGQNLTPSTQKS